MKRKSQIFNKVPVNRTARNMFDLSHEVKMSGKFGLNYPVFVMDTLPGDVVNCQTTAMVRFAPMLAPIMHRVDVKVDYFFVPNRLLCDSWEDFITGGQDGEDATVLPYVTPATITSNLATAYMTKGSLWDYLGLPIWDGVTPASPDSTQHVSILPFRAYMKVWNDYFRDPNLDDEIDLFTELNGDVTVQPLTALCMLVRARGWERDLFTSALPWAQRGQSVLLPLAGTGTVEYSDPTYVVGAGAITEGNMQIKAGLSPTIKYIGDGVNAQNLQIQNIDSVTLDSSEITINDFRRALAIQKWMENNAVGGGRYIEQIESHFNVRVPDYRLQRAEYLGGGRNPVAISQVLSTADTDDVPVGDMAGHGISVGKSNRFRYRCSEHGWILGILSVVPRTAYSQGIDKMFTKEDRYDFAFPEFAHLGEQELLSKEVYYSFDNADDADNNLVFGYTPRYAEYKFRQDRLAGDFRDTLAFWHLGRIFNQRPELDDEFVTMYENAQAYDETFRRIFAVQDGTDYLWMQLFHNVTAMRPLPYFGVPSLQG